jgi:hypothetical protein
MSERKDKGKKPRLERRPYHQPRLTIYGDVNRLTRAMDFTSPTADGATGMWGPFTLPLRS